MIWLVVIVFIIGLTLVSYVRPFIDEWGDRNQEWRQDNNVEDTYRSYIAYRTIGTILMVLALIIFLMYIFEISRKSFKHRQYQQQSPQYQHPIQQPKVKVCRNCYAVLGIEQNECPNCGIKGI